MSTPAHFNGEKPTIDVSDAVMEARSHGDNRPSSLSPAGQ
jgi:hypothetical protein